MSGREDESWANLVAHCHQQQVLQGRADAEVAMKMRGKWGKQKRRRLFRGVRGGPLGTIVGSDASGNLTVLFRADEVIASIDWLTLTDSKGEAP